MKKAKGVKTSGVKSVVEIGGGQVRIVIELPFAEVMALLGRGVDDELERRERGIRGR